MISSTIKKINKISPNYSFNKWSIIILPLILISSILEMIGLGLILPLINLLFDKNVFILKINEFFGTNYLPTGYVTIFFFIFIAFFYFIKNFYLIYLNNFLLKYTTNFQINLSEKLITNYSKKNYIDIIKINSSLLTRNVLKEVGVLKNTLLSLFHIFSDSIFIIFTIIFISTITIEFVFLFIIFIFSLIFAYFLFFKKKFNIYGFQRVKYLGYSLKYLNEYVNSLKLIKIFDKDKSIIDDFKEANRIAQNSDKNKSMLMEVIRRLSETLFITFFLIFLLFLITSGQNTFEIVSQLSLLAASAFRIFPAINRLNMNFQTLRYNSKSTDILYALFKNKKLVNKRTSNILSVKNIELKNIGFKYPETDNYLFKKINFIISKGETVFFVGKSGTGKSSLANIISGLLEPTNGEIYINGKKVDITKQDISRIIGYVSQDNYLLDTTIKKNIALDTKKIDMDKIVYVTKKLKLHNFINKLPKKFNSIIGETGLKISGGQKQRLCIARALYKNPEILIFDEPTSAVDKKAAQNIMKHIINLQNIIKIIITHDEKTIPAKCKKIRL